MADLQGSGVIIGNPDGLELCLLSRNLRKCLRFFSSKNFNFFEEKPKFSTMKDIELCFVVALRSLSPKIYTDFLHNVTNTLFIPPDLHLNDTHTPPPPTKKRHIRVKNTFENFLHSANNVALIKKYPS